MPNPSTTVSNQRTEGQTTLICTGKQGVEEEEQTCQRSRIAFMEAVPSASGKYQVQVQGLLQSAVGPKMKITMLFYRSVLKFVAGSFFFNNTSIWINYHHLRCDVGTP